MAGHRIILLGASNLKRSFPVAVRVMQQALAPPWDFHVAMGYGRSYGVEAGYLGKKFSGIFSSSIWRSLDDQSELCTMAFVTDIGNDLGYEVDVKTIVSWVTDCVDRLQQGGSRVVLTALPMEPLRSLSALKFVFFRRLLFPFSHLTRSQLLDRAEALNEELRDLAESKNIPIFYVPNAWYGFDPIHIRPAFWRTFWECQLDCLNVCPATHEASLGSAWVRAYLRWLNSPRVSQWGRTSHVTSTPIVLHDGARITLH